MLSVPFFVAGTVALLFGTRALWRVRAAIVLTFLAWPLPLRLLLGRFSEDVTQLTSEVLAGLLPWIFRHSVGPIMGADSSLSELELVLRRHGDLEVAGSAVTFAVFGGALGALARGRWHAKVTWLLLGIILNWTVDGALQLSASAAMAQSGTYLAHQLMRFHELVALGCTVLVMNLWAPVFGLKLARTSSLAAASGRRRRHSSASNLPSPKRANLALVVSAAAVLAVSNGSLQRFSAVAGPFGHPRLPSFEGIGAPLVPDGWRLTGVPSGRTSGKPTDVNLTRQLFGPDAAWYRFRYSQDPPRGSMGSRPPFSASVDVVTTPRSRSLVMRGLEEVYGFGNYEVVDRQNIEVASGVAGTALVHKSLRGGRLWATLHWTLPVHTEEADLYERVVVATDIGSSEASVIGALTSFGRALVAEQVANAQIGRSR
jgi:hypothetical protein